MPILRFYKCLFLVLIIVFTIQPAKAHYLSENVQWTNNSGVMLKTSLGWEFDEVWTMAGSYYSTYVFKVKGGEVMLDFHHWIGWQGWMDFLMMENESTISVGFGHQQVLLLDNLAVGLTGGLSRTVINKAFQVKGTDLIQWEPLMSLTIELGIDWVLTMDGCYYLYEFDLSQEILDQYGYLLKDREFMNSLYADFILYQAGLAIGFDGQNWGFYNLKFENAKTYSKGYIMTYQLMWTKNISKRWTLTINSQLTSKKNILLGTEIGFKF